MVAVKFFGIIITFYLFVVHEAFGQNFYAARYGKRSDGESEAEKNMPEGKRLGRRENEEALSGRQTRFFISGGRYGKRGCSRENCSQGSMEDFGIGFKRKTKKGLAGNEDLVCIYTGLGDFYRCSNRENSRDNELMNSNSISQYFQ